MKPKLENYVFIGDYIADARAWESSRRAEAAKLIGMIGFVVIFSIAAVIKL